MAGVDHEVQRAHLRLERHLHLRVDPRRLVHGVDHFEGLVAVVALASEVRDLTGNPFGEPKGLRGPGFYHLEVVGSVFDVFTVDLVFLPSARLAVHDL